MESGLFSLFYYICHKADQKKLVPDFVYFMSLRFAGEA